jgi:hypothetical protein
MSCTGRRPRSRSDKKPTHGWDPIFEQRKIAAWTWRAKRLWQSSWTKTKTAENEISGVEQKQAAANQWREEQTTKKENQDRAAWEGNQSFGWFHSWGKQILIWISRCPWSGTKRVTPLQQGHATTRIRSPFFWQIKHGAKRTPAHAKPEQQRPELLLIWRQERRKQEAWDFSRAEQLEAGITGGTTSRAAWDGRKILAWADQIEQEPIQALEHEIPSRKEENQSGSPWPSGVLEERQPEQKTIRRTGALPAAGFEEKKQTPRSGKRI